MTKPFSQVDAFGHTPFAGNPVAVVADADDQGLWVGDSSAVALSDTINL